MHTDQHNHDDFFNSLGKIERAKAPDFFQTRLMARLEKEVMPKKLTVWQRALKPVPVLALSGCLVVLNLYTLGNMFSEKEVPVQPTAENIAGFASEYNLYNTVDINH